MDKLAGRWLAKWVGKWVDKLAGRWLAKLVGKLVDKLAGRWLAKWVGKWVDKLAGRWLAKLVAHLLATDALLFRIKTSLKIQNGRHKQKSGQHILARQNILKN